VVTAGGRELTVVGRGATFEDAIARAYTGVSKISFAGMHYRRDIGRKAL
jgi:phosphoribosylamine--glycine ligase